MAEPAAPATDQNGVEIALKGARRDSETVRRALARWLRPRLEGAGPLEVSELTTPGGTGVANETLLFDASWSTAGRERTAGFAARVATERPLYIEADIEIH